MWLVKHSCRFGMVEEETCRHLQIFTKSLLDPFLLKRPSMKIKVSPQSIGYHHWQTCHPQSHPKRGGIPSPRLAFEHLWMRPSSVPTKNRWLWSLCEWKSKPRRRLDPKKLTAVRHCQLTAKAFIFSGLIYTMVTPFKKPEIGG